MALAPWYTNHVGVLDIAIVLIYLFCVIGIGVLSSKKVVTMVDYLVAGRRISPYLGVASLGGTELGLITVMYNAQKGFSAGLSALHMAIIAGVVTKAYEENRIDLIQSNDCGCITGIPNL